METVDKAPYARYALWIVIEFLSAAVPWLEGLPPYHRTCGSLALRIVIQFLSVAVPWLEGSPLYHRTCGPLTETGKKKHEGYLTTETGRQKTVLDRAEDPMEARDVVSSCLLCCN
jgi:hypothetical protein